MLPDGSQERSVIGLCSKTGPWYRMVFPRSSRVKVENLDFPTTRMDTVRKYIGQNEARWRSEERDPTWTCRTWKAMWKRWGQTTLAEGLLHVLLEVVHSFLQHFLLGAAALCHQLYVPLYLAPGPLHHPPCSAPQHDTANYCFWEPLHLPRKEVHVQIRMLSPSLVPNFFSPSLLALPSAGDTRGRP